MESQSMNDPINGLKDTLSYHLLSAPYDPDGYTPEHQAIRYLTNLTRDWAIGDLSDQQLVRAFASRIPDFDIMLWLTDAGVLEPS